MERKFVERCREKDTEWTMERVKGLGRVAEELKAFVLDPVLASNLEKPVSVLLYGSAGVGKTALIKALQASFPGNFLLVSVPELVCSSSFPCLQAVLTYCDSQGPCILCLDEVDMLRSLSQGTKTLLRNWLAANRTVGVVGVTAYPWRVEEEFRLETRIWVPLPDEEARKEMFLMEKWLSDEEISVLISRTEGFTGVDIANIKRDALMEPIRECVSAGYVVIRENRVYPASQNAPGAQPISALERATGVSLRPPTLVHSNQNEYLSRPIQSSVTEREIEQFRAFHNTQHS
jgi:SpoVK/Ycf46/Vps4 family AAA+-type ATPase